MFKWLNKQGVEEIVKGFSIQRLDRFQTQYKEGDDTITFYTELTREGGRVCDMITSDVFDRWDSGVSVPENKRKEIMQNYKEAMAFKDMGVIVD